jgi:hypothetical protein
MKPEIFNFTFHDDTRQRCPPQAFLFEPLNEDIDRKFEGVPKQTCRGATRTRPAVAHRYETTCAGRRRLTPENWPSDYMPSAES